jgi:hypothetical protein
MPSEAMVKKFPDLVQTAESQHPSAPAECENKGNCLVSGRICRNPFSVQQSKFCYDLFGSGHYTE